MSDPNAKPQKIRVKLTAEERILLASLLQAARTRDAEKARRRQRIIKTLGVGIPDPRAGRKTFELLNAGERAALQFEVIEIKNPKGEVVNHAPKLNVSKDKPTELRFLPGDHAELIEFLDPLPEGLDQPTGYQWLGLLDAFDINGGLEDDFTEPDEPDGAQDDDGARTSKSAGPRASEPAAEEAPAS